MKRSMIILSLVLIMSILLAGCNYPGRPTPTSQVDAMNTAAAQTIQARLTLIAQEEQTPTLSEMSTATLEPPVGNGTITATPEPSLTPANTHTSTVQVKCDQAAFVSETIPDGTDYSPGQAFTKTWTLKNIGSCTWNANYDVVFISGASMNAPASQALTDSTVGPGETVKISLDLEAPTAAGTQRGDFKLRNANGVLFGIGAKDSLFWVEIDVKGTLYDFTDNYCASGVTWTSNAGSLPCPGSYGDSEGWVRKINKPTLENGVVDNEPGLQVHPQKVNDGWIRGTFPEISITGGVYFKAIVGCYGTANCDVKFKLNYTIDGGTEKTLATWHEVQDDKFTRVKVDLSTLSGEKVKFILLVEANGSSTNDEALWFGPRIEP